MKVGLYVRVSTVEQTENYSIGEQTERLEKYCEAMGWEIFKVYTDGGYSGGNMDRPALTQMIDDIKAGLLDKVVVYKLDRLSRSQYDTLYLIDKVFIANDTDFVSMTENFSTTSAIGKATMGLLAVFSELEKSRIAERMTMGKQARAKEGKWCGGRNIPIGYDYDKVNEKFIINDFEAMQYRELVRMFLDGTGFREIEKIFAEKGYVHKHGKWMPKTMRDVLRSKIYLGYLKYGGQWYKAEHTPLIDEETHETIVELLNKRAEAYKLSGGKSGVITTYLGGLLFCKKCGAKYGKTKSGTKDKDGNYKQRYVCYSRSKKMHSLVKDVNCKNKNWKIDELDNIVLGEIKKLAINTDYVQEIYDNRLEQSDAAEDIKILKKEIQKLDEQISRFMDLYGIGKFTVQQVASKVDPLNLQRYALTKEIEYLSRTPGQITKEETFEILESVEDAIEEGDFHEIRQIIESLIHKIELDEDNITIYWKFA